MPEESEIKTEQTESESNKVVVIETDITEGEDHFVIHTIGRSHYWSLYHKGKCNASHGPFRTKFECIKSIKNLVNNLGYKKVIYVKQSELNRRK